MKYVARVFCAVLGHQLVPVYMSDQACFTWSGYICARCGKVVC